MNIQSCENNIQFLKSMIGLPIESAIQEQYFYKGVLFTESMGSLNIKLSNEQEFTFDCHGDAESLLIAEGGLGDFETIEPEFENNVQIYKWEQKEFLSAERLNQLGQISEIFLELVDYKYAMIHGGCKLKFANGDYLYIWTTESDNIFYGINEIPPYHSKENLKIELKDINTL